MRKVLAFAILIGLAVALYFYVDGINHSKELRQELNDNVLTELEILNNIEDNYEALVEKMRSLQKTPDQITKFNCMITQIIYSEDLTEEQLQLLVELERESYHKDLLTKNPKNIQLDRLSTQLESYAGLGNDGLKIIGYESIAPKLYTDEEGNERAIVNVLYYLSLTNIVAEGDNGQDGNLYKGYVLEKNNENLWEIVGWGDIDEFLIVD